MSDADGVGPRESDEFVYREILRCELCDEGGGVIEGSGESDFIAPGDYAVAAAGGNLVEDVAGEGGAVT